MNKEIKKIISEVIEEIKPPSNSLDKANEFIRELNFLLSENKIDANAVLGGSMAKNTHLKNDYDADVFVKFNKKYKGDDISSILEKALKKKYLLERVKGSRDYFHIKKEFLFEVVPVLDVESINDAENVIDMSPMHVNYFKNNGKELEDDVRLLKYFMKANRVYGAESFINGFSGHVVDLLIIKYKSFFNTLKAAKIWKPKVIIDLEKKLKDPLMELDREKISGPLIIVDPVQENRNAAAALSDDCFEKFKIASNEFIKNPSKKFFERKDAKQVLIDEYKHEHVFELIIEPMRGNEDIVGTKILKLLKFIHTKLKENDFKTEFNWDFGYPTKAYFSTNTTTLDAKKIVRGPPTNIKKHCDLFKNKHESVFERDNFLYAEIKRKYTNIKTMIHDLLNDEHVTSRCKSIKLAHK